MLAVAAGAIPQLYSQAKWYHVLVAGEREGWGDRFTY